MFNLSLQGMPSQAQVSFSLSTLNNPGSITEIRCKMYPEYSLSRTSLIQEGLAAQVFIFKPKDEIRGSVYILSRSEWCYVTTADGYSD